MEVNGKTLEVGYFPTIPHWPYVLLDGERVAVNLPEFPHDGEVAIRDYAEFEGVLAELVAAKVVAPPHRYVRSGWVEIPVCMLLVRIDE